MPKRIADTRSMTMADAESAFADLAQAALRIERRNAMAEVRISKIKAALGEENALDAALVAEAENVLTQYVLSHPDQFRKPRQRATEFGKFGLRTATRLDVADEDAALEALMGMGYYDCVMMIKKIDKPAITKRIQGGEGIPGCDVRTGDLLTYTVDRALRDEAREGVA